MQRRKFLNLTALASLAVLSSSALSAKDFRVSKPNVWTAHTVDEAITNMYGDISPLHEGLNLKVPASASNGKSVPIEVSSDIEAKSLTIFQNANPEATVIAFTLHKNSVIDYSIKIKMQKGPRVVTAILEGTDGKFYIATQNVVVADGGCEG